MDLMLTSFGISESPEEIDRQSPFFHLPPVGLLGFENYFVPDYSLLLLYEKVIMDEISFLRLMEGAPPYYWQVAETFKVLQAEGFIELKAFRPILWKNQVLLERMLDHDMDMLEHWIRPLGKSLSLWREFVDRAIMRSPPSSSRLAGMTPSIEYSLHTASVSQSMNMVRLSFWEDAKANNDTEAAERVQEELRPILRSYLSYVNANIVLSNELGVGFHDWKDFLPFYQQKFLPVGQEDPSEEKLIEASGQLFEVAFPEFAVADTGTLIRILRDKRVGDLRHLIQEAAEGKVEFDMKFARGVFKEVLGIERQVSRYRSLISYVTIPLDFIPWVGTAVQLLTEEIAGQMMEAKLKEKYRWFYMLSDIVEGSPA